jgi:hypothetical protein
MTGATEYKATARFVAANEDLAQGVRRRAAGRRRAADPHRRNISTFIVVKPGTS